MGKKQRIFEIIFPPFSSCLNECVSLRRNLYSVYSSLDIQRSLIFDLNLIFLTSLEIKLLIVLDITSFFNRRNKY